MKRFLAVIISVYLLLSTVLSFAFADDHSSSVRTLWDSCLYNLCKMGDGTTTSAGVDGFEISVGAGNGIANFTSHFSDAICGNSSDHLHHADSLNQWQGNNTENDHGAYAYATCKYCGKTFKYYADDLKQDYNNYVHDNNLDNGISVTPASGDTPSGFVWYPTFADASLIELLVPNSDYSVSSLPSTLYDSSRSLTYSGSGRDLHVSVFGRLSSSYIGVTKLGCRLSFSAPVSGSYSSCPYPQTYFGRYPDHTDGPVSNTVPAGTFVFNSFVKGQTITFDFIYGRGPNKECTSYTFDSTIPSFNVAVSGDFPSIPASITINNNNYHVTDFNFDLRQYHVTNENNENITITYEDDRVTIHNDTTDETTYNYYIIEVDPGNDDPDPSSSTDPGPGDGSSSTSGGGAAGSGSGGAGCCEQCALLLRQVNIHLFNIYTLVDEINDKLGPDADNYMQGIYNLLVDIHAAMDNLSTSPHDDYEQILLTISNQLADIHSDLVDIKNTFESVEENTATTNDKLDTVHDDLAAVLEELQEQKGILGQILSVLRDLLRHVTNIDANVADLADEQSQQSFIGGLYRKFGFINQVYAITRQMMADVTNDAISAQAVSDGVLPALSLTSDHTDPDSSGDSGGASAQSVNAGSGGSGSRSAGGTAPEVITRFPDVEVMGFNLSSYSAIDLSWYAPYKSEVDTILSGFMYLGYIWLLFKRLPSIIRGGAMASADYEKVQEQWYGKKGD